ncbi:hypothetical protein CL621_03785 [archaeon]|nr:hypothetical protein [archaeon]|tara:strand:- start:52 stop:324 length:273 start_codon:yes stop_codon:yes gene_type:complete
MIHSDYQNLIEKFVTNGRRFYDSTDIKFLRHCTSCDLIDISEENRLENTLAMMEMRDNKMTVYERLNWLMKNPDLYSNSELGLFIFTKMF